MPEPIYKGFQSGLSIFLEYIKSFFWRFFADILEMVIPYLEIDEITSKGLEVAGF